MSTETKTVKKVKTFTLTKVDVPKMKNVVLHNNTTTAFIAVMDILSQVFKKGQTEAFKLMMHAHENGSVVVLKSTEKVCKEKIEECEKLCTVMELEKPLVIDIMSGYLVPSKYKDLKFTMEDDD